MADPNQAGDRVPKPDAKGHYQLIEAGRGLACLGVVFFHSLISYSNGTLPPALAYLRVVSKWGWLGVHVFFAISGWCIAERITKGFGIGESGRHFAAERALRIYPTYWVALIAAIALRAAAVPFNTAHLSGTAPTGWLDWFGSMSLLSPYLGSSSYLLVSWSLVFELGFYLCAAVALVAARNRIAGGTPLFIVGCVMCLPQCSSMWSVLGLWPNFFAGMAAWWATRHGDKILGYGALAVLLAATVAWPAYGGMGRLVAICAAWVLALAYRRGATSSQAGLMRFFTWMGGISYSLYLVHVPLMSPFLHLAGRCIPSVSPWFVVVWAFAIALAIVGAKCLNHFVEAPIEVWRKRVI